MFIVVVVVIVFKIVGGVGVVVGVVVVGTDGGKSSRESFVPRVFDPDKSIRIKVALLFGLAGEK